VGLARRDVGTTPLGRPGLEPGTNALKGRMFCLVYRSQLLFCCYNPSTGCRFSAPREPNVARLAGRECQSSGQKRGALRDESDFRCAALRSAVVQRAERIRFRDQKITAPHTDGVKGGCSPQNNLRKPRRYDVLRNCKSLVKKKLFRSGEVRIFDSMGNVERIIPFDDANRKL
jgi:hypothetical protein